MFGVLVDCNDVVVVYYVVGEVIVCVCCGEGLMFIEVKIDCYFGYFQGDLEIYCLKDEVKYLCEFDFINLFGNSLWVLGLFDDNVDSVLWVVILVCIDVVYDFGCNSLYLELGEVLNYVFVY